MSIYAPKLHMFVRPVLRSRSAMNPSSIITTLHARFPRFLLPEDNTHRKKSKNARSSRAVPITKLIEEVKNTPFIPWHWGRNQAGMQAKEDWDETVWIQDVLMPLNGYAYGHTSDFAGLVEEKTGLTREDAWLVARDRAVQAAEAFAKAGYHKQLVNRILEPFMWVDALWTATEWNNFLWLRDHEDAEPHFMDLAKLVREALDSPTDQVLQPGDWHLPYVEVEDWDLARAYLKTGRIIRSEPSPAEHITVLRKISAARCARISYAPFNGDGTFEAELDRFDKLVGSDRIHASPTEHQATPDTQSHYDLTRVEDGKEELIRSEMMWDSPELHGNLTGWIQHRKLIPNEFISG